MALRNRSGLAFLLVSAVFAPACDPATDGGDDPGTEVGPGGKADGINGALEDADEFFGEGTFWFVQIKGWDPTRMSNDKLFDEVCAGDPGLEFATLTIAFADADENVHCPSIATEQIVYSTNEFCLRTSGNLTNGTPKSSYKIDLEGGKANRFVGMEKLNLKSMWNDVSQMREHIAWEMFDDANLPASRHTYAKLCMDPRGAEHPNIYRGLYSVIENVDKRFIDDRGKHFGKNEDGNLYKANFGDVGPATLDRLGDDGSDYFHSPDLEARTYELKTNDDEDDDPALQTYDDLAQLIDVIHAVGIEGEGDARFESDAYRQSVEDVFDVYGFLRWAGLNVLMGSWDNYWRSPSNYYLYNSGKAGAPDGFMAQPYFHFIPHDYDNSFGIDYFRKAWEDPCKGVCDNSLIEWEAATTGTVKPGTDARASLPLIRNVLKNPHFRAYYLDFVQHALDEIFTTQRIDGLIGTEGSDAAWDRVRRPAFLEADGPTKAPHTGRQFTNDQVFFNGFQHMQLEKGEQFTWGIRHYAIMRRASAKAELDELRAANPAGGSGVTFPVEPTPLPAAQ